MVAPAQRYRVGVRSKLSAVGNFKEYLYRSFPQGLVLVEETPIPVI